MLEIVLNGYSTKKNDTLRKITYKLYGTNCSKEKTWKLMNDLIACNRDIPSDVFFGWSDLQVNSKFTDKPLPPHKLYFAAHEDPITGKIKRCHAKLTTHQQLLKKTINHHPTPIREAFHKIINGNFQLRNIIGTLKLKEVLHKLSNTEKKDIAIISSATHSYQGFIHEQAEKFLEQLTSTNHTLQKFLSSTKNQRHEIRPTLNKKTRELNKSLNKVIQKITRLSPTKANYLHDTSSLIRQARHSGKSNFNMLNTEEAKLLLKYSKRAMVITRSCIVIDFGLGGWEVYEKFQKGDDWIEAAISETGALSTSILAGEIAAYGITLLFGPIGWLVVIGGTLAAYGIEELMATQLERLYKRRIRY